jgi:hypothetical protein
MPERVRPPDVADRVARPPDRGPTAPRPSAGLLALQQSAGNAAVARLVASQRPLARAPVDAGAPPGPVDAGAPPGPVGGPAPAPGAPPAAAPAPGSAGSFEAMTLNTLDSTARGQADWAKGLAGADHDELVGVLEYGRLSHGGDTPVMSALGKMKVGDLRAPVKDGARRKKLTDFSLHATPSSPSVVIETPAPDVAAAEKTGEGVAQLDAGAGTVIVGRVFVQRADAPLLEQLITKGYVADFINYVKTAAPNMAGSDGVEIDSYLKMRDEGVEPVSQFVGKMGHSQVRNYHRFLRDSLQGLKDANAKPAGSEPLTLILHTAEDHNGAFHRKSELSAVIMRPGHNAVMVEGAQSLAEITALIPGLAALGQGGKIAEAVVAGHGDARTVGMAVKPDGTEEAIDLNNPANGTNDLLKTLMANMSTDPNARVVLAACLTGSDEVPNAVQGGTDADKRADVKKQIAANPSLRTHLTGMLAPGSKAQVVGSNVSIPFPTMIDPADPKGPLTIDSPENPKATADRIPFIKVANEPEGALRAVLAAWADDPATTWAAVAERMGKNQGMDIHSHMTKVLFGIVHGAHQSDPEFIRQLSIFARAFDFLPFQGEHCRTSLFAGMPGGHDAAIFDGIRATSDWGEAGLWYMRLVTLQAWAARDVSQAPLVMAELGKVPTLAGAIQYLDVPWIAGHIAALVPAAAPGGVGPASGELRLALLAADNGIGTEKGGHVQTFLAGLLGSDPQFPAGLGVPALLENTGISEYGVIEQVRPTAPSGGGGGGGAFKPDPNVDTDGKPGNDRYVEPVTRHGIVAPTALNVRTGPGMGFRIADVTRKGDELYVIGKSGNWFAVEWKGATRFVHKRFVDLEDVSEGTP